MSDRVDTEAVRGQFPDHGQSHERYVLHRLCDELDRTREALDSEIARCEALVAARVRDIDELVRLRAALAEGDTERPETCPTCGSRDRAYCNNVRAQASWVTCADPWHSDLGAEER